MIGNPQLRRRLGVRNFFFLENGHPSLQSAIALDGLLEGLLRCEAAAGVVGAAVEVAVSAVAEDEGAAALGTNAGSYFAVGCVLGGIDVADVGSVVHLIPDVLLG